MDQQPVRDEIRDSAQDAQKRNTERDAALGGALALALVIMLCGGGALIASGLPQALAIAAGSAPAAVTDGEPTIVDADLVDFFEQREPLIVDDVRTPGRMHASRETDAAS